MPAREEILAAMKKAASFYSTKVSTGGGYHFSYTDDLSYGRSEQTETPHRVQLQREGTPIVAMAFLDAYNARGDSLYLDAARRAGSQLVNGQLCSGGWDYHIEFRPEERKKYPYRADGNCGSPTKVVTTLDDNVTQANTRFLMRLDHTLQFKDAAIHQAARFALDSLIQAQYPVGAWPQRYSEFPDPAKFPVKKASYPESWSRRWPGEVYKNHYTFNDNTTADCIDMMLEAARIYNEPRYLASAEKGGQFILLAQMPDPQPAWAQQYDADMHPAWARVFEPPSITGGESQGVLRLLMLLYSETGNRKYLEPVPRALDYLKRSLLPPTSTPSAFAVRPLSTATASSLTTANAPGAAAIVTVSVPLPVIALGARRRSPPSVGSEKLAGMASVGPATAASAAGLLVMAMAPALLTALTTRNFSVDAKLLSYQAAPGWLKKLFRASTVPVRRVAT